MKLWKLLDDNYLSNLKIDLVVSDDNYVYKSLEIKIDLVLSYNQQVIAAGLIVGHQVPGGQ